MCGGGRLGGDDNQQGYRNHRGDNDDHEVSTTSKETRTHTTTTSPCENGGRVVDQFVVKYDRVSGFDLTASKQTIKRGEQITFRLENITDTGQESGVKSKYAIHRETAEGWRDIFYPAGEELLYYDTAEIQQPGKGFTWKVRFSQSGLAHDIKEGHGSLDVCTPLQPGTYRFVYWGIITEEERESDFEQEYALGVRFLISGD